MHSVRLEIGKKIFEVMVISELDQSAYIEFPIYFPGSSSYEESNESYMRWILNSLRAGDNLFVTVGQFERVVKPDDKTPMLDPVKAFGEVLNFNDLPERNLKGLTEKIAKFAQGWARYLV